MAQKGWNWLLTHILVEAAKALGGSFKLVTLAPKTVKETQKNGDTNKSKGQTDKIRQDRLQYTAPQLASAQCNKNKSSEPCERHKSLFIFKYHFY